MDEGDSEEEGLELNNGTVYGRKAPSGSKPKPSEKVGGASRGARKGGKKSADRGTGAGGTGEAGGSGGGGTSGSGGGGNGGGGGGDPPGDPPRDPPEDPNKGKKCGDDDGDDDPEDDPNKKLKLDPPARKGPRQKRGKPRGGKAGGGGKQPKVRNLQYTGPCLAYQETYPPVDDMNPVFYINRTKQPTTLGYVVLEWTEAQKCKCHEARLEGCLV